MTDDATRAGAAEIQTATPCGELSELRSRGDEGANTLHPVRPAERQTLSVGDRIELTGRVSFTGETSSGDQWVTVMLDGEPEHMISCWTSNATQRQSPAKGEP